MSKIVDSKNYRFPTMCIDKFWADPDAVVDLAMAQEFSEQHDSYPGLRTKELGNILPKFNEIMINKIISLFIDIKKYNNIEITTKHFFQKISPISEDKKINVGMVHQDSQDYFDAAGDILSCIVYLNKNPVVDAGTSIFQEKYANSDYFWFDKKNSNQDVLLHNSKFIETIRFQNIYNRLILYDSCHMHAINTLASDEDRLTQVFFCDSIISGTFPPGLRAKQYEYYK
jgi:hypothetical protein